MSSTLPFNLTSPPQLKVYGQNLNKITQTEEGDVEKHKTEIAVWGILTHNYSLYAEPPGQVSYNFDGYAAEMMDKIVGSDELGEDWRDVIRKYKLTPKLEADHPELTKLYYEHRAHFYTLPATITTSRFWRISGEVQTVAQERTTTEEFIYGSERSQLAKLDQTLKHMVTNRKKIGGGASGGLSIGPINFGATIDAEEEKANTKEQGASKSNVSSIKHTAQFKISQTSKLLAGQTYCNWELVEHVNVKFDVPSYIFEERVAGVFLFAPSNYGSIIDDQSIKEIAEIEEDYYLPIMSIYQDSCKTDQLGTKEINKTIIT